ncbi:acyltransferase [Sphingomonas sinipercae]|uniref:Acyltransferase n=1 Tax=Sphingomonas sinipercae TaxID=2714944 RepID=A0A6G7ZM60_9SPHN|nr:acyltransferase [Sphingomonas sinipercae]QIL02015.1 acyltransferase [Sphingomonas sinipercae]
MSIESLPQAGEQNHFTLVRLVAASAVIVGHSSLVALGPNAPDPFFVLGEYHLATTAVIAFFAISGYFVSMSFERRTSTFDFILARAARIIPGLLAVSLITTLLIGPLFTALAPADYFSQASVWLYPLRATSVLRVMAARLPEMFPANPFPSGVNIPLWTLYYETACYAGLLVAGLLGLSRRFGLLLLLWIPAYLVARYGPWDELVPFARFSLPFVLGMAAYRYRSLAPFKGWAALSLLVVAGGLAWTGSGVEEIWSAAIGYGVLCLGFMRAPLLLPFNQIGDFSYGTYIYGFMVQQSIAAVFPGIGLAGMIALAVPAAILCGALSWHFVERPAIDWRKRRAARGRLPSGASDDSAPA